tara:strand:- start:379 stop:525 length:147 start_codon:yes stop_codon:yes gene_type:complete
MLQPPPSCTPAPLLPPPHATAAAQAQVQAQAQAQAAVRRGGGGCVGWS